VRWWRYSGSRRHETGRGVERWHCTIYCLEFCAGFNDAERQHLLTINTDSDLSFTTIQQQTYRRKQHYWRKRDQVRFREVVNTCTERRAEKRIQQTALILSHVLRKTLCEHVNGLCPAGWLNEQSITKHWFQSVRTCPYSWATGLNCSSFFRRSNANQGIFLFKFVFLVDMFSACTAPLLGLKHFDLIDWNGRGQFFCVWWCCTQLFFFKKKQL